MATGRQCSLIYGCSFLTCCMDDRPSLQITVRAPAPQPVFESITTIKCLAKGYQRVLARDGAAAGLREGRELGVRTGFEVAEEVAFYHGCTQVLLHFLTINSRASLVGGCNSASPDLRRYCNRSSDISLKIYC